jgi:hypothetical protein
MIIKPLLMLAAFVVVVSLVSFSWAIPFPGRDALTGRWVGEVRSSAGPGAWLYMNLEIAPGHRAMLFGFNTALGTDATLCTPRRRVDFSVFGSNETWSGDSVELVLEPRPAHPSVPRLEVTGNWDGHTLELKESEHSLAYVLDEPNERAVGSTDSSHWIAATLKRGTRPQFDALCANRARR